MRIQMALLLVLIGCFPGLRSADTPETVRLSFFITTTFGVPLEKALVTIVSVGPAQKFTSSSNSSGEVVFKVPSGLYDVDVNLPGFLTRHERIGAYQTSLIYRLGLVLVYTHAAVPPELQGTLSPVAAGNTDRWVRLLSLYGGGLFENSVDDKGKFVLTGFAPGKYLLLLLDKDKIVSTQQLEILGGVKTVNISTIGQE